jgi:Tol biopolymer transport system component
MPAKSYSSNALDYLDFEIEIGPSPGGQTYPVAVLRSPAGEARDTMRFPFDRLALNNQLLSLQNALLRSGVTRRRIAAPDEQAVQDFGRALFDALIAGEIRSRFDTSLRLSEQGGRGLRLKLRINAPELALLPWELLYDSRRDEYVTLSRSTPIVRYLELPQSVSPLRVAPPLRILGMIASPTDLQPLDVPLERQRVEAAVADLRARGLVELTWLEGQTWRDLQRAMRGGPWHVFHFVGHGDFDRNRDEGTIALADEHGRTFKLSATSLGRLLDDHFSLRLAVLNACEGAHGSEKDLMSSTAATLVGRGIPAVLAMQHEISDDAAIELAHTFYEAIADGLPVDAAVAEARKAICLAVPNSVEWSTPVLFLRAADGRIFDVDPNAQPVPPVDPEPAPIVEPVPQRSWWARLTGAVHDLPPGVMRPALLAAGVVLALTAGFFAVRAFNENRARVAGTGGGPDASPIATATTGPATQTPAPATQTPAPPTPTEELVVVPPLPSEGWLAFTREIESGDRNSWEIVVLDLATGEEQQLTDDDVPDYFPRWSPDGSAIAFTSIYAEDLPRGNFDTWVMGADGSDAEPWWENPAWDEYPAWSPDGDAIVLATTSVHDGVDNPELHVVDGDGNWERLTYNTAHDEWPDWSPDGSQIVFASNRDGAMGLYLIDPDSGEESVLINSPAHESSPRWSPDGSRIAFVRKAASNDPYGDLWLLDLEDGSLQRLTTTGDAGDLAWSPDGQWIAFGRGIDLDGDDRFTDADRSDLWAVSLDDLSLTPLLESEYSDFAPSWAAP